MLKSHLKSGNNLSSATGLQPVINNASLAYKKRLFQSLYHSGQWQRIGQRSRFDFTDLLCPLLLAEKNK